jgi:hypothetical protein
VGLLLVGVVLLAAWAVSRGTAGMAPPGAPGAGAAPVGAGGADLSFQGGIGVTGPRSGGKGLQATGTAGGAAVGSVVPGVGTAVGAAVGAIVGATVGAILNEQARHRASREGWQAVQNGINDYFSQLAAAGVTDSDTASYIVYTWAADFGNRGRNGLPPWPGKVPVALAGIQASERLRDAARASLLARGVGLPAVTLVSGQVVPGQPARPVAQAPIAIAPTGAPPAGPVPVGYVSSGFAAR